MTTTLTKSHEGSASEAWWLNCLKKREPAMRIPRPRFTVRWLMIATAIIGVGLGLPLERRAASLRREAARHSGDSTLVSLEEMYNPTTDASRDHHRAMAEKYYHAARYPWLPVAPDPPEPR
jgi:hypothetical protein